ncbi:MAG: hypothetical protein QIT40_gp08 [Lokiarchaeia virus VerdaV4]|uniref:Uncharacterized protein n=1 Tax=Lokiarchaeia virus VerdaV4 TaxID=3070172 RepID=A0AA35G9T1_9CAUD|nr:MAG: hypothetical protein QIT40_gp08 [Lokiarchaeia virus VerdaV4]BDI54966.1 MAG: hypothetical protein [Lokiarchaeia virus VerdaV4]
MVNTLISEIAKKIALGENKFKESQLLDVAIKAGEIVMMTVTGITLAWSAKGVFFGVMKEHEEFDLDTDITALKHGDVVTEGYAAVFITSISDTYYPGEFLYVSTTQDGQLVLTANGPPAAMLMRTINTGDKVAIVKLMR